MYFHPLNSYTRESEFLDALEGMMTLGLLTRLAYSALAILCDSGFFAHASYGARHAFRKCLCRGFLEAKLLKHLQHVAEQILAWLA